MSKTNRIKAPAAGFVPQSVEEVTAAIAQIGQAQRARARIEAAMNDALAGIKEAHELQAKPYAELIAEFTRGVQLYCEAHRDELTRGGKTKTVNLASGEVKWRMRPPSVSVRGVDLVIELLRKMGLGRFLREKVEVNKEAILAEPDAVRGVPGISIRQGEDFVVLPYESQLEEVA